MSIDQFTTMVGTYINRLVTKFLQQELYFEIIRNQEEYITDDNLVMDVINPDEGPTEVISLDKYAMKIVFMLERFINSPAALKDREKLFSVYPLLNRDCVLMHMIILVINEIQAFRFSFLIESEYVDLIFKISIIPYDIQTYLRNKIEEGTD